MAQTGDPKGDGTGGSGKELKAEFNSLRHLRGTVSMAREGDNVDSADSQFFIMFSAKRALDRNYTVWGRVIEGMEAVDQIHAGTEENNGKVDFPDSIKSLRVAADMTPEERGPSTPTVPSPGEGTPE
jgi:peptidylprolyl isomerase